MSNHLKKGCPLPISIIAEERARLGRRVKDLFWGFTYKERQAIVTERTILFMDKFRNQTKLLDHIAESDFITANFGGHWECLKCGFKTKNESVLGEHLEKYPDHDITGDEEE